MTTTLKTITEAVIVDGLEVYGVDNISQVIEFFNDGTPLEPTVVDTRDEFFQALEHPEFDFAEEILQDDGFISQLPSYVYLDWERTARDIMMDYATDNNHYFRMQ